MNELGTTNMRISALGMGTWAIGGGPAWGDRDEEQCIETIVQAPEKGINLIDTAPAYNFGNSERIVGKALKRMDRSKVRIITKCGIVWDREGSLFNKVGDRQLYKNLSPDSIRREVEDSLQRLQTDYIDIYMTHWQSVEPYYTPVSETMKALMRLKEEGLIKAVGAANVTEKHIRDYTACGELDLVQGKYSILDREAEKNLLPVCREKKITFQAYSPLEQGLLSGKYTKDYVPKGAQANKKWFQKENIGKVIAMLEEWKPLCEKYHCSDAQLALAWLMGQGDDINVLTGCSKVEQLNENAGALHVKLETEDMERMRKAADL